MHIHPGTSRCSLHVYGFVPPALSLGDNERECPDSASEYGSVLEMKRSLEQNSADQDRFFQKVRSAKDGFSVIAEYFGKGIITSSSSATATNVKAKAISILLNHFAGFGGYEQGPVAGAAGFLYLDSRGSVIWLNLVGGSDSVAILLGCD
ncbi:Vacuolar protein-sorting-associated protein 11-like protein [Drosera capensis]